MILDAPPLLPVTDAGLLSAFCDGALLVQATGQTQIEQSQHCRRILDQVGSRLLGVVLNKAPLRGVQRHRLRRCLRRYGGYGGYAAEKATQCRLLRRQARADARGRQTDASRPEGLSRPRGSRARR